MLAPTYVSENSPRAIRGFLVGFFQLLLVMGGMTAYFINYGSLLHLPVSLSSYKQVHDHGAAVLTLIEKGKNSWMVPLGMQALCPGLLLISMLFCPESPRWLASQDRWDEASATLSDVRHLPREHAYIQQELLELRTQLEQEQAVLQGAGFWALQKECWTVSANRKRALLSMGVVMGSQWSGVSTFIYYAVLRLKLTRADRRAQLLCAVDFCKPWIIIHDNCTLCTRSIRNCEGGDMRHIHVLSRRHDRTAHLSRLDWLSANVLHVFYWICKLWQVSCICPYVNHNDST